MAGRKSAVILLWTLAWPVCTLDGIPRYRPGTDWVKVKRAMGAPYSLLIFHVHRYPKSLRMWVRVKKHLILDSIAEMLAR
jgi:hypothetical protein